MVIDNAPTVAEAIVDETAGLSELCINNGTAEPVSIILPSTCEFERFLEKELNSVAIVPQGVPDGVCDSKKEKDEILDSVECLKKEIEDTTAEQVTNELEVLNLGEATNPVKKKWPKKEKKPDPPLFLKGSEEPISKENLEHYHSQKLAIKASDAYLQSLEKINEEVAKIEPVEDWNDVPHEAEDPEKPFFEPCLSSGLVEPPVPWSELPEEPKVEAPKAPEPEAVIDSWLLVPPVDEDDELIDESDGSSKETYSETSDFSDSDEFLATYARTARFYTSATPDT